MLKADPYRSIFLSKMPNLEQNGLMEKLNTLIGVFKPLESEPLEPLKMEHFYLVYIGIFVGLFFSFLSYVMEVLDNRYKQKK